MTKRASLVRLREDGTVKIVARFSWPGHGPALVEPVAENGETVVRNIIGDGLVDRSNGVTLSPADGETFIDALSRLVSSDFIWVTRATTED